VAKRATTSAAKPRRWEIWEIDLDPGKGREQQGVRPCLVISIDALNQSNFGTIIVCPMTTKDRPSFKWRPGLVPSELHVVANGWTAKASWVETDQFATIDVQIGAGRHLATLTDAKRRAAVEDSVRLMLGL
jgi:mRNA interferase MazF